MFLIILLIIVTAAISGSAAYFSVFGLAHIFTAAFIPSIVMGASLEAGKLVGASFLYQYWHKIGIIFKSTLLVLIAGLMLFTSMGIFGFLSSAYQTGTIDMKDTEQRIEYLSQQKTDYENRLLNIDEQIKNVPSNYVSKKIELLKALDVEKKDVLTKLESVTDQRNELLSKKITTEAKVGPIIYVAKALDKPVDNAIVYMIVMIMVIFDPLAVTLTIATNVAIKTRQEEKNIIVEPQTVSEPQQPVSAAIDAATFNSIMEKMNEMSDTLKRNEKRKDIMNSVRDI